MKLTEQQIRKAISLLNIQVTGSKNGNWLGLVCPLHSETTPGGSCFINLESAMINCFSCHQKISIIDLAKQRLNLPFNDIIKMIDGHFEISFPISNIKIKQKERKESKVIHNFEEIRFDPNHYYYTRKREFTQDFCKQFNVTRCLSGIYNDYMIVPIKDSIKGINEFEARRLFEYEQLNMFFNIIEGNYEKLKKKFEKYIKREKIELRNYLLYKNNVLFYDDQLKYLLQPKVRYVSGSQAYRTLFNIDNLKFDETLWLTEGICSLPKIWTYISKNCSCTFGSNIDKEQIELLAKFKRIVIIPDFDLAGYEMIKELNKSLNSFSVKNIKSEDTDESYIEDIKTKCELSPGDYLTKYMKLGLQNSKIIF
jgi:DNA primase